MAFTIPGLLGMNNQQPDPYQSLLGGYYTPQQAKMAWLGGSLQGLGAGLASGKSGAWAQGLALGGGEGLDNYRQRAVAASALDMRKKEYDYQQQQREEEAAARQAEEDAQAAAIAGLPPEMQSMAKAFPSAVIPSYVKNKYFPDPVAYEAPQTKTIYDPNTGQEQVVQWSNGDWVPLGGKKAQGDTRSSATELKELWKSEDELPVLDNTIASLDRALELNDKTFTGYTAGVRGALGTKVWGGDMLVDPNAAAATEEWGKIMSMEAIQAMAANLKGATTDMELNRFVEMLADPTTPPAIRKGIINRMKTLAERQKAIKTQRIKELRGSNGNGGAPQPVVTEDGYTIEAVPEN